MDLLRKSRPYITTAAAASVALCACVPDLDTDESRVDEPRILAVQAEPAEASANEAVTYRALVADRDGPYTRARLTWYYCMAKKPLAELGPVSRDCLQGSSGQLDRIDRGLEVEGTLPADACSLFGPNPPAPVGDEPPGRPVDPDQTGGYKFPVMLGLDVGGGQEVSLFEQRIACALANVNAQLSVEFAQRYHKNQNPSVQELVAVRANGDRETLGEGDLLTVRASERITLHVRWPSCPERDECGDGVCGPDERTLECRRDCDEQLRCEGQERYLWFDTESRELKVRKESLRLAWYGTDGAFEDERTGVAEDDEARESKNAWSAPEKSGELTLWVVLRDSRGGVGFRQLDVRVR